MTRSKLLKTLGQLAESANTIRDMAAQVQHQPILTEAKDLQHRLDNLYSHLRATWLSVKV